MMALASTNVSIPGLSPRKKSLLTDGTMGCQCHPTCCGLQPLRSSQQSIEEFKAYLEIYLELCHECDLQVGLAAQNQQRDHFGSSTSSQNRHHHWLQTTHNCLLQSHNQQLKKRNETFLDSVHLVPCFGKVAVKWLCPQCAALGTKSHKKKNFPGLKTGHALHTRNREVRFSEIRFSQAFFLRHSITQPHCLSNC